MREVRILKPGLLTSVQDAGRWGYLNYGVAPAGPMDPYAFRMANILVDNEEDEAALEITMLGPTLEFACDCVIAVTGADVVISLDGNAVPAGRALTVKKGQVLSFGPVKAGCRNYLAFAGGIGTPPVFGSRATHLRAQMGGIDGRLLKEGDVLPLKGEVTYLPYMEARLAAVENRPKSVTRIRVLAGQQEYKFTQEALERFYSGTGFVISPKSDRQGIRLEGERIPHKDGGDITTDGIVRGAIQVPSDEQPIILMADHQTTGGYAKIATVITADLSAVSQAMPGTRLVFSPVGIEEAQALIRAKEDTLGRIKQALRSGSFKIQSYTLGIGGGTFAVSAVEWG